MFAKALGSGGLDRDVPAATRQIDAWACLTGETPDNSMARAARAARPPSYDGRVNAETVAFAGTGDDRAIT